jgi:hypothetical protein
VFVHLTYSFCCFMAGHDYFTDLRKQQINSEQKGRATTCKRDISCVTWKGSMTGPITRLEMLTAARGSCRGLLGYENKFIQLHVTNLLTPWSRSLLQKLTVTQLAKESSPHLLTLFP